MPAVCWWPLVFNDLLKTSYLSSTPPMREVIKRPAANQLHGNSTPTRISRSCPHCLRRYRNLRFLSARTVTGQEYHYSLSLLSPYWMPSNIYSRRLLALSQKSILFSQVIFKFTLGCHGAIVNVAFAFDKNKRNVLDECLFSCQDSWKEFKFTHSSGVVSSVVNLYILTCIGTRNAFCEVYSE